MKKKQHRRLILEIQHLKREIVDEVMGAYIREMNVLAQRNAELERENADLLARAALR